MIAAPSPSGSAQTDTDALNYLIDQAGAGDWIQLEPGQYQRNKPIPARSGLQLVGCGRGATSIQLAAGSNCDLLQTDGLAAGAVQSGFAVRNLTLDQNGGVQTAGSVANLNGHRYDLDGVDFLNGHDNGVVMNWQNGPNLQSRMEIRMRSCTVDGHYNGSGVYYNGAHDGQFQDIIISTFNALHGGTGTVTGFNVGPNGNGAVVSSVHVYGRHTNGFYGQGQFSNCEAEGAFNANLVLVSGTVWSGGTIYGTKSQSGQANETGIQVGDANASNGCSQACVTGVYLHQFADPGRPVSFAKDWGPNMIHATVVGSGLTSVASGAPSANSEYVLLAFPRSAALIQRPV